MIRKLAGTERDLEAIAARVGELTREANALAAGHPAQAPAINARLGEVQAGWEDLRATMRRREESLGEARRLQDFLRSLDDFQAWLGRTQTSVASEEGPATLPEAEALLAQHAALRGEVERARSESAGPRRGRSRGPPGGRSPAPTPAWSSCCLCPGGRLRAGVHAGVPFSQILGVCRPDSHRRSVSTKHIL